MNGISFLADTNAFIYLMEGEFYYPQLLDELWGFSFITEIELLSKKDLTVAQNRNYQYTFRELF